MIGRAQRRRREDRSLRLRFWLVRCTVDRRRVVHGVDRCLQRAHSAAEHRAVESDIGLTVTVTVGSGRVDRRDRLQRVVRRGERASVDLPHRAASGIGDLLELEVERERRRLQPGHGIDAGHLVGRPCRPGRRCRNVGAPERQAVEHGLLQGLLVVDRHHAALGEVVVLGPLECLADRVVAVEALREQHHEALGQQHPVDLAVPEPGLRHVRERATTRERLGPVLAERARRDLLRHAQTRVAAHGEEQ